MAPSWVTAPTVLKKREPLLAMVLLASGYILYDTSNILHHYRTDQHVAAALALFASVALLFWYVIQILIHLSGDD